MKIKGKKVIIRSKKPSDAEHDYRWLTDAELSALDAMLPMTMSFQEFFREYIGILKHPPENRIMFAVETREGEHIGNCVYYNIDEANRETEIGIMIGNRGYWDQNYGTDVITTLLDYIFRRFKFNRIYLKTLETNFRAQRCFEKCGLTPCGHLQRDGYRFLLMDITFSKWQELKGKAK